MEFIWNRIATDEEIANCNGDYYGCEICRNCNRCAELLIQRLNQANNQTRISATDQTNL